MTPRMGARAEGDSPRVEAGTAQLLELALELLLPVVPPLGHLWRDTCEETKKMGGHEFGHGASGGMGGPVVAQREVKF